MTGISKVRQSWVAKNMSEKEDKSYLNELMKDTMTSRLEGNTLVPLALPSNIQKNIAPKEKPDKDEAVKTMHTRFKIEIYTFFYRRVLRPSTEIVLTLNDDSIKA